MGEYHWTFEDKLRAFVERTKDWTPEDWWRHGREANRRLSKTGETVRTGSDRGTELAGQGRIADGVDGGGGADK